MVSKLKNERKTEKTSKLQSTSLNVEPFVMNSFYHIESNWFYGKCVGVRPCVRVFVCVFLTPSTSKSLSVCWSHSRPFLYLSDLNYINEIGNFSCSARKWFGKKWIAAELRFSVRKSAGAKWWRRRWRKTIPVPRPPSGSSSSRVRPTNATRTIYPSSPGRRDGRR